MGWFGKRGVLRLQVKVFPRESSMLGHALT